MAIITSNCRSNRSTVRAADCNRTSFAVALVCVTVPETVKVSPSTSLSSDRTVPALLVVSSTVPPSVTLSVSFTTVGASFAPFTVKVIVEDVVVVPSETVKVNTSVPLSLCLRRQH